MAHETSIICTCHNKTGWILVNKKISIFEVKSIRIYIFELHLWFT